MSEKVPWIKIKRKNTLLKANLTAGKSCCAAANREGKTLLNLVFVRQPATVPGMGLIRVNAAAESAGPWQEHFATDAHRDRMSKNGPPV